MKTYELFTLKKLGSIDLKNRIVMAPMTRCRAIDNIPNDLMAEYYKQRSNAGLIITEGLHLQMGLVMPEFQVYLVNTSRGLEKNNQSRS
jgi:2,4-dienoyl-CoA reductase-like NADH-dependent reductase (Old Yellow Enzyme family)